MKYSTLIWISADVKKENPLQYYKQIISISMLDPENELLCCGCCWLVLVSVGC